LAPLEAVLFDINGTLSDSDQIHIGAFFQQLLQQVRDAWVTTIHHRLSLLAAFLENFFLSHKLDMVCSTYIEYVLL
jgi:phosphoglycolate phosphatase-like HAD superfamily hydrolase